MSKQGTITQRKGFLLLALIMTTFFMFTCNVSANGDVTFKVTFQGKDISNGCTAVIMTAQGQLMQVFEGTSNGLKGNLPSGTYDAMITLEEPSDFGYDVDKMLFDAPGMAWITFTVKKGVNNVVEVKLPTVGEFMQGDGMLKILMIAGSMGGISMGPDMGMGNFDFNFDFDDDDDDYSDYGSGFYNPSFFGEAPQGGVWGYQGNTVEEPKPEPDIRPDLLPYGPKYGEK